MTARRPTLDEPVVISKFWKNRRRDTAIVVSLNPYEGLSLIDVREHFIGADGRNSLVRKQLGFSIETDQPHNLIGGMLVANVPEWPRDMQVIGTEDRLHYLVFPQGKDLVRLYACYGFSDKGDYRGAAFSASN